MRLIVNGTPMEVAERMVLSDLVLQIYADRVGNPSESPTGLDGPAGVAVAVDGEIIPRSEWQSFVTASGQQIEIVTASAGG